MIIAALIPYLVIFSVMPGFMPGIHVFFSKQDVDGRDIGVLKERRSSNG